MRIRIVGKPKKGSIREIKSAARYYAEKIITSAHRKNLHISITFEPLARDWGWVRETFVPGSYPTIFDICLNSSAGRYRLFTTLGHEIAHVEQKRSGKWRTLTNEDEVWKGEKFTCPDSKDSDSQFDHYWFAPWEIEARGLEKALYRSWKREKAKRQKAARQRSSTAGKRRTTSS